MSQLYLASYYRANCASPSFPPGPAQVVLEKHQRAIGANLPFSQAAVVVAYDHLVLLDHLPWIKAIAATISVIREHSLFPAYRLSTFPFHQFSHPFFYRGRHHLFCSCRPSLEIYSSLSFIFDHLSSPQVFLAFSRFSLALNHFHLDHFIFFIMP